MYEFIRRRLVLRYTIGTFLISVAITILSTVAVSAPLTIRSEKGVIATFDAKSANLGATEISPLIIPDDDPDGRNISFHIPGDYQILSTSLSFEIEHTYVSDLVIKFTHPDGTETVLRGRSSEDTTIHGNVIVFNYGDGGTFSRVLNLIHEQQKSTKGKWTINISDVSPGSSGELKFLQLVFKVKDFEK